MQGQTRARIDQSWASQNSILQGYCRLTFPDVIIRYESLADELGRIESDIGLPTVPLGPSGEAEFCYALGDVYTDEMEQLAQDVYARDYQMFGFGSWG